MGLEGAELNLPQEMLAVLPSDPQEQLDMARRITARAVAVSMSKLEAETGKLRQKLTAKEHVMLGLQERMIQAQTTLQETNAKILLSMDEQAELVNEKNALAIQVKKLFRDVTKLETFKRTLVQSLQDDERPSGDDGGNREGRPQNLAIWKASQLAVSTVTRAQIFEDNGQYANSLTTENSDEVVTKSVPVIPKPTSARTTPNLRGTRIPARGTPRRTPTGSPKPESKIQIPTSLPTSRSNSPNRGSGKSRTLRRDGEDFFRQARRRLTYEQFIAVLENVKELHAQRQSLEEALGNAEDLFGSENKDLYNSFQGILNRHLPS